MCPPISSEAADTKNDRTANTRALNFDGSLLNLLIQMEPRAFYHSNHGMTNNNEPVSSG